MTGIEHERAVARSWAALTDTQREAMRCSQSYRALADALDGQPRRLDSDLVIVAWRATRNLAQAVLHATHGDLAQDLDKLAGVTP